MEKLLWTSEKIGAKLVYDDELNALILYSWGDHSDLEAYKEKFNQIKIHYVPEKNSHVMFESTLLTKSPASGRAWFSTNIVPQFQNMPTNPEKVKVYIVQPTSFFEKMTIEIMTKAAKLTGLKAEIKLFSDVEEAKRNLKS